MLFRMVYGLLVVAVFLLVFASLVAANGRDLGVRWEDTPLKAKFEDAKGTKCSLSRAKVKKGDETTHQLDIRIGETEISVPLAKIRRIEFKKAKADQAGYVPAELVLHDGTKETPEVKVVESGEPLFLTGYTKFGPGEVALSKCVWIEFEVLDSGKVPTSRPLAVPEL